MAKYLDFKYPGASRAEALQKKLEAAPLENAEALLKAYALLDIANKHGILDVLKGAISAEDAILDKVSGYANTPEGINTVRNLLVVGKLAGSIDPDFLHDASHELISSVVKEAKQEPKGIFGTVRRMFSGDALRGLYILIAGLEALGRTARLGKKS
jgi:uncharacterized protein YjgD (DUF1641 family)